MQITFFGVSKNDSIVKTMFDHQCLYFQNRWSQYFYRKCNVF